MSETFEARLKTALDRNEQRMNAKPWEPPADVTDLVLGILREADAALAQLQQERDAAEKRAAEYHVDKRLAEGRTRVVEQERDALQEALKRLEPFLELDGCEFPEWDKAVKQARAALATSQKGS